MIVSVFGRGVHLAQLARECELPVVVFVPLWWLEELLHELDAPVWMLNAYGELVGDLFLWWRGDDQ